jgi:hypothetical protein
MLWIWIGFITLLLLFLALDLGVFHRHAHVVGFLHGMIPPEGKTLADTTAGTCASMLVMYVAVGRRLSYPLKLVTTNSHVFVRWDGQNHDMPAWRETFNIEGTGEGISFPDDDYYKTWPIPINDEQVKASRYLLSLGPAEELAMFLAARGHSGEDHGQYAFAARCYESAVGYDPSRPGYRQWFAASARNVPDYEPRTPRCGC